MKHVPFASALVLGLALTGTYCQAETVSSDGNCPDISGRYRAYGPDHEVRDALAAIKAFSNNSKGRLIEIQWVSDGAFQVSSGTANSEWGMSKPTRLVEGTDFTCNDGFIRFKEVAESVRKEDGDEYPYSGTSIVEIGKSGNQTLSVTVTFSGSKKISLFSYDSANVEIRKPGTQRTFVETLHWEALSDSDFESLTRIPEKEPESFVEIRRMLSARILGDTRLIGLKQSSEGVLASLRASRDDDIVDLENNLRAAWIAYDSKREPVWSNNDYSFEFLIRTGDADDGRASRPSLLRVGKELRDLAWPLAQFGEVTAADTGFEATFQLEQPHSAEALVERLKANSRLLGEFELVETPPGHSAVAEPRIHLRMQLR
ncbi:MAG: hypothetical protein E6Q43_02410 [Dokdonella sp.]|nr:MAG: hypothetical protein EYC71_09210 [Gammaproteobacteria bacterium]TXI76260.1 MAG: hypothetical protein E6Q43_02410 [Dokdonella sp.]